MSLWSLRSNATSVYRPVFTHMSGAWLELRESHDWREEQSVDVARQKMEEGYKQNRCWNGMRVIEV